MAGRAGRGAWWVDVPLLGVAVVWGGSYLVAKELATAQTVLPVLVLRFAVVLPVLFVFGFRGLRALTREQVRGGLLLGGILGLVLLLETYGVVHTSATNAGLIISLTMIFTPAAESLVARVRLSRGFLAAAGLSVVGVALLTQGAGFTSPSPGDGLMLLAALVRTVSVLASSRLRSVRDAAALPLTTVQLSGAVVAFGLVCLLPGTGPAPWALAAGFGGGQWLRLVFLSVFCTLFAFAVQMWAVRRTSPSRVALLLGTEPLWAAVVGVSLGGDHLGVAGVVGAVLVLAGTAWGRRAAPSSAPSSAPAPDAEPTGDAVSDSRRTDEDLIVQP
ncbi:drug/metabolite transporter (DMT)-like permease [Streptacidiphilus sp. MAP12-20]|uniref:DMT family transporter n=1 Tax=Streptacidiphilus sp. MAP12-20 TaxID=3156299 RepID=UPI003516DAD6